MTLEISALVVVIRLYFKLRDFSGSPCKSFSRSTCRLFPSSLSDVIFVN